ncbi:MAG: hypothetical protein KDA77_23775, partial [Planctomycetaceae bacterium]|nr:hypothetical protein [Planctomycetaceae bacterium]
MLGLAGFGESTKAKLVFTDGNNKEVTVNVEGLTGTTKNYKVTRAMLELIGSLDVTQIRAISIVVDDVLAGSQTAIGALAVNTSGLNFTPVATVTAGPVTDFSGQRPTAGALEPCATLNQNPCVDGTLDTVPGFVQTSPGSVAFSYDLSNGSLDVNNSDFRLFGGTLINFGLDSANWFDASGGIVLGLAATGGSSKVKLVFTDGNNEEITVNVEGLTGTVKNYLVTRQQIEILGNVDASMIRAISIVVDDVLSGSQTATGNVVLATSGLAYTPVAVVTTNALTDFSGVRPSAGQLEPCATLNQNPCTDGTLNTV